jgi:hypothetical protein
MHGLHVAGICELSLVRDDAVRRESLHVRQDGVAANATGRRLRSPTARVSERYESAAPPWWTINQTAPASAHAYVDAQTNSPSRTERQATRAYALVRSPAWRFGMALSRLPA